MNIYIANDHGGVDLKKYIYTRLKNKYQVVDLTPDSRKGDDYPSQAAILAQTVGRNRNAMGIGICRSGIGMCITANKFPKIRAVCANNVNTASRARRDEDTNILCLGGDVTSPADAIKIISAFINTKFKNIPRYRRRLSQIAAYERKLRN